MSVRQRVADLVDEYAAAAAARTPIGEQIADHLAAEGLLNNREVYATAGDLKSGDRIMLNDATQGPTIYLVTDNDVAFGEANVTGVREHTMEAPTMVLCAPANMHVRKVEDQ